MGDWFDLNNDGKLDPFEEACKLSHINNSLNYLKQENEKKERQENQYTNYNNSSNTGAGVGGIFFIAIIIDLILVFFS